MAFKHLSSLKRKRMGKETLKHNYTSCMKDRLLKGFISPVEEDKRHGSLPHHEVLHPRKPARIVLDCAATASGVSLNDAVLQGADWTSKLMGVPCQFRRPPVAVTADMIEICLQVRRKPKDRRAFSFLRIFTRRKTTDDRTSFVDYRSPKLVTRIGCIICQQTETTGFHKNSSWLSVCHN